MKITKLEHSGLAVEKDGQTILIDPIEIDQTLPEFPNVIAIIITHQHSDHLQSSVIQRLLAAFPSMRIYAPGDTLPQIPEAKQIRNGSLAETGDFKMVFFSENHAPIFKGEIPCQNVGVVVDGMVAHPGDSFDLPQKQVDLLCVPISAPWSKISDVADYVQSARPKSVLPIHDAVLSPFGRNFHINCLKKICEQNNVTLFDLKPGESIEG